MKHGTIAGNDSINQKIYDCFKYISEKDERSFVKKFAKQPHKGPQVMHTFRELLVGAYLGSHGFKVVNELRVGDKAPDWSIVDKYERPIAIVEVVNFHIDRLTEEDIEQHFLNEQIWAGWRAEILQTNRLYSCVQSKFAAYKDLASIERLPYIVSLHGDFYAAVRPDEIRECLSNPDNGLFQSYPEVSGLLFFEISFNDYHFKFTPNPKALHQFHLPDGIF